MFSEMEKIKIITKLTMLLMFAMTASLGDGIMGQAATKFETVSSKGAKTTNEEPSYVKWSEPVGSHLYHNADGTYNRVEHSGKYLYSELYTADFKYKSGKKIKLELPCWGGVYIADDAYYVLLGKNNVKQKKNVPEFRIIKYNKKWEKLGSKDIMNANTIAPFDAGSCRFVEMNGDLYVRTCHQMYRSSDGLCHQASVMMRIRMSDLEILACQSNVANFSYGYVSHSFNQFLDKKNGRIYACDHGDAHPRGIAVMSFQEIQGNSFFENRNTAVGNVFKFYGKSGDNNTEASLGGFAVSDTHTISVGNSVKQTKTGVRTEVRNIYVATFPDTGGKSNLAWITNYSPKGKRTTGTPKLVRVSDSRFLLMWEEEYKDRYDGIRYCFLDGIGKRVSAIKTVYASLSDCQPIIVGDRVVWYATSNSSPVFYSLPINGEEPSFPAVKTSFIRSGIKYQITKSGKKKKEVKVIGYKKSQLPEDIALDVVYYEGYRFKVTEIGKNAFKNYKKFLSVEIGVDVKKIGAGAFYGCSKLGTVRFSRKKYTANSIGKNAFAKIRFNAFVVVPKKRLAAYKKLLKKKGLPSTTYFFV